MPRKHLLTRALNLLHALLCGIHSSITESYQDWLGLSADCSSNYDELCSVQYLLTPRQLRNKTQRNPIISSKSPSEFFKQWPRHLLDEMTAQVVLNELFLICTCTVVTKEIMSYIQISTELWQSLTTNVTSLSQIRLFQWQQLFDIISIASAGDAYSAGKAFEVFC